MSEITSRTFARHLDIDDVTYSANVTLLKHATLGGLSLLQVFFSLQISSEPFVKLTFQAILQVQFAPNIIPNKHAGHHKTNAK